MVHKVKKTWGFAQSLIVSPWRWDPLTAPKGSC